MSHFLITLLIFLSFSLNAKAVEKSFQDQLKNWSQSKNTSKVKRLNSFYDLYWDYLMKTYPEWATYQGYPGQNDRWTDRSFAGVEKRKLETQATLKALSTLSEQGLQGEDLLNYRLLRLRLQEEVDNFKFPEHLLAIDQMGGIHADMSDLFMMAPKTTKKDYQDMLKRLQAAPLAIDQTMELLQQGLKSKVTQPKITLAGLPSQFEKLLTEKIEDSPISNAFAEIKPDVMSTAEAAAVQTQAKEIIATKIYPSLKKLRDFLIKEYIPNCRESIGWSTLPDGQNWYNARIKAQTTVDLTSEQIHQLGLSEVSRIQKEMAQVRQQLKFGGSEKQFNETLKDSKFYFTKESDLLDKFRAIGKTIDPELPKFFGRLPQLPYGVKEMPAFKAPNSPAAYYEGGSLQAGRSGFFIANTYDLKARPKWAMIDLTCHEAVPGHHLQISLAQELGPLPEFRKNMGYTSYVEGWALYSENLCDDMGLYKDAYDKYGQLSSELWRAVRLVVDTGIHAKGWTRDQATSYFRTAGPFAEQEIQSETNRYIVWAGQALAYKLGQLKILELREKAKKTLGEKFDIRKFHDEVLSSGALPLGVLDQKLTEWMKRQK